MAKRILQVIGIMNRGGAETMIMNFYRAIDRTKYQFDFLVFSDKTGDYDAEIEKLGGKIYRLPVFKIYNYFSFKKSVKKFFSEHHWEVIHGHIRSSASIYLEEAKKHGSYAIAHCHSTDGECFIIKTLYHMLTYRIRYVADYFMACSVEAGVAGFGKKVENSDRFMVLKNAINCGDYQYNEERHIALKKKFQLEDKFVIGHVGRFVEVKNHDFLIDVFNEIQKNRSDAVLVLVGRGNLEKQIKEKAKKLGIDEKVKFMGLRSDIPDIMNLFDIFIFPSHYEGLGIVGIEAQAAGLPCVFSDNIPQEAIITDNVIKLSLNEKANTWAEAIINIYEEYVRKDQYDVIDKSGYNITTEVKKLEKKYEEGFKKVRK